MGACAPYCHGIYLTHKSNHHHYPFQWFQQLLVTVAAAAAKSHQSYPTVRPRRRQPNRLLCPWDSPGKNTGVGCHFLFQCMKVKSESEVTQLCLTLSDPMPLIFMENIYSSLHSQKPYFECPLPTSKTVEVRENLGFCSLYGSLLLIQGEVKSA